jgi:hypothetical protein
MRFAIFFCFVLFVATVSSFDFDYSDSNDDSSNVEIRVAEVVSATSAGATTVAVVSEADTATSTQAPQEPLGRAVSSSPKKETIGQIQLTSANQTTYKPDVPAEKRRDDATTTTSTTTTTTSTFIKQPDVVVGESLKRDVVEVIINKSIYRLVDEALRERLINFESRIASLLYKRQIIETEIDAFIKKTDNVMSDDFFPKEKDRYKSF